MSTVLPQTQTSPQTSQFKQVMTYTLDVMTTYIIFYGMSTIIFLLGLLLFVWGLKNHGYIRMFIGLILLIAGGLPLIPAMGQGLMFSAGFFAVALLFYFAFGGKIIKDVAKAGTIASILGNSLGSAGGVAKKLGLL